MAVLIASIEFPALQIRLEGPLPDYNSTTHEFRLNCPVGDDWLQYISHTPQPAPLLVRSEGATSFVVFDRGCDAQSFEKWLLQAREEQDRGYRTMRG